MHIKSLTIYCSSSNNLKKKYYDLSNKIGEFLGKKKIKIIYGGGSVGMMGEVSKSSMKAGGEVIGIIPKFLDKKEIINKNITKLITVNDMSKRKELLFKKGDAFLVLPGGSGTIEEAAEVISWSYLQIHKKPIIIFNFDKYWDSMIQMYENTKSNKFGDKNLLSICKIVETFQEFSNLINNVKN